MKGINIINRFIIAASLPHYSVLMNSIKCEKAVKGLNPEVISKVG